MNSIRTEYIEDVINNLKNVADSLEACEDFSLMIQVCDVIKTLENVKESWHTGIPPKEDLENEYCYALCLYYDGWNLSDYLFRPNFEEGCFETYPRDGDDKPIKFKFENNPDSSLRWKKIETYNE